MAANASQSQIEIQEPISLEQFTEIIQTMSPAEIAKLPLDILPSHIPSDIADQAPPGVRGVVEDLLLSLNTFHLKKRLADVENYGEDIAGAMDRAKTSCASNSLRVFKNKILTLIDTLQASKQDAKPVTEDTIVNQVVSINNLLIDVRSESQSMENTLSVLESVLPITDHDKKRFDSLISRVSKAIGVTENTLSEYYILRLKLLAKIMLDKRKFIESNEEILRQFNERLALLKEDLEKTKSIWKRTVQRKATLEEEELIQKMIEDQINEINQKEIVISENDLILWLDTIVDATLSRKSQERAAKSLRSSRISLYYLLNRFCLAQEQSAIQIAQNPYIQVDPEQAIRYVFLSEEFILNYFTKRKNDKTAWLSGAAESKLAELDVLQKDILTELKRASKGIL
ncbi:MAG: hypothetical protein AAF372_03455 [Pseudomonadota bacterium]